MSDLLGEFVRDFETVQGALAGCNDDVLAAWERLRTRLVPPYVGNPPGADGRVAGEVAYLAWHLHKIALIGETPRPDSLGMEWLIFRYTVATEAMAEMLQKILEGSRE